MNVQIWVSNQIITGYLIRDEEGVIERVVVGVIRAMKRKR